MRPGRPAHLLRARNERAQRQARGDALGETHDVGFDAPVLDRQQVTCSPHARLHLIGHKQDPVLQRQLAQPGQEVVRGNEVTALALDRFDKDRRDALGRRHGGEQLLDPLDRLVSGHPARGSGERSVEHRREQRRKSPALACLGCGHARRQPRADRRARKYPRLRRRPRSARGSS